MKIKRENVVVWILGMIVLGILAALGWRVWERFGASTRMCYVPNEQMPSQSMDHSSLTSRYHALGVISDEAFEKLSGARHDA